MWVWAGNLLKIYKNCSIKRRYLGIFSVRASAKKIKRWALTALACKKGGGRVGVEELRRIMSTAVLESKGINVPKL